MRLDPDVLIRPHHRGKGNFVARGSRGGCQVKHLEGKQSPVPQAETETMVVGKKRFSSLYPLAPQSLLASLRPQILFGGNFLLKCTRHTEKCTQKGDTFSQRQHIR